MLPNISNKKRLCFIILGVLLVCFVTVIFYVFSDIVIIRYNLNEFKIVNKNVEYLIDEGRPIEPIYLNYSSSKLSKLKEINIHCRETTNLQLLKYLSSLESLTITIDDCKSNLDNTILDSMPTMNNVTELSIVCYYGKSITDKTMWLEKFPNLSHLYILSRNLSDISGIKKLKNLTILEIEDMGKSMNSTFDISGLKDCEHLQHLTIKTSRSNVPDTASLYQCKNIISLSMYSDNPEYDLNNIAKMKSLKELSVGFRLENSDKNTIASISRQQKKFLEQLDEYNFYEY